MKNSSKFSHNNNKRHQFNHHLIPRKKPRKITQNSAILHIKPLNLPLISTITNSPCESIHLKPDKPYTIGRNYHRCEFIFKDRKVSKVHCQIIYDSSKKKVYLSDGIGFSFSECVSRVRVSLNGIFVNGDRIMEGGVSEFRAGDEVSFVCGDEGDCGTGDRIGFSVEKIVFVEEVVDRNVFGAGGTSVSLNNGIVRSKCDERIAKVSVLLSMCRGILCSDNPISYIRKCVSVNGEVGVNGCKSRVNKFFHMLSSSPLEFPVNGLLDKDVIDRKCRQEGSSGVDLSPSQNLGSKSHKETTVVSKRNTELKCCNGSGRDIEHVNDCGDEFQLVDKTGIPNECCTVAEDKTAGRSGGCMGKEQNAAYKDMRDENWREFVPPPGRKFYLNRLQFMDQNSSETQNAVSLPELFYPVESLQRVFIATFTSDIRWFLSYCEIPADLPVTIACHSVERCWSSSPDKRTSIPYSDFPNVVLVYPSFPEVIAFGKDRKKLGIACHHPKLLLLQRENSLRVVITSANLVAKQWQHVTNTVWWQDFPRSSTADFFSLFTQLSDGEVNQSSKCDFAAQLAGFVASLVADVPSQAHWILELTKYDFKGAVGYLVASIPGIYSHRSPLVSDSRYFLVGSQHLPKSFGAKVLGSVEAFVVGLSHLFRSSADHDGARLKKLAAFLGKCRQNVHGMSEVVLRRVTNILVDTNAVSVLVPDPDELCMQDCVQIGFLPRNVAKWVAPLSDVGLFTFSAYIYPKEVLATALEGSNNKVQLILYVTEGPSFPSISEVMHPEHVSALSSLVASIQRCAGLWRLQEVLSLYKWPEHQETEFLFGSSSIGAVNAQFLAAFSAAVGKRSLKFTESEESDPDWGCWSASQELRNPSIRIIFPTIERVKNASSGILASKRILCFSQKTWERLKTVGILHDAIPYPSNRVGLPMHVKVARRRFQSNGGASSCGWVYCGSHNFSAAAWGRPLSSSVDRNASGAVRNYSVLGSRLHICNYELGIIFIAHPSDTEGCSNHKSMSLDDIVLPFVAPAPKYALRDRPATAHAMREALAELSVREREICEAVTVAGGWMDVEIPVEEDELLETDTYVTAEKEDEKAYAETLWSQVDASESC